MVGGFYDYGRWGTCYVFKFHPVISLVTEKNKGYPLSGYPKNRSHNSICLLGRLVPDHSHWFGVYTRSTNQDSATSTRSATLTTCLFLSGYQMTLWKPWPVACIQTSFIFYSNFTYIRPCQHHPSTLQTPWHSHSYYITLSGHSADEFNLTLLSNHPHL